LQAHNKKGQKEAGGNESRLVKMNRSCIVFKQKTIQPEHFPSQAHTTFYIPIPTLYTTPSPRPLSPDTVARAVKAMLALFLANTVEKGKKTVSQPYPYFIFRKNMGHC
jgi:hypothetical protein